MTQSNFTKIIPLSPPEDRSKVDVSVSSTPLAGKEGEPLQVKTEITPSDEIGPETHAEVEKQEEKSEQVHEIPETPEIDEDLAAAGVTVTPAAAPLPSLEAMVKTPLPDDQIAVGLHQPVTSGFRWLAEICRYMLRQGHIKVKKVGNSFVRTRS